MEKEKKTSLELVQQNKKYRIFFKGTSDPGELRNANHLLNVVLTFDQLQPVPGFIYLYVCLSFRSARPSYRPIINVPFLTFSQTRPVPIYLFKQQHFSIY